MWQVPRRLPYAAATAATDMSCSTSSCRPTRARPFVVPLHPHTTPAYTAPPTRPAPITTPTTTTVQTLPHTPTPLHILCPPAFVFPITLWFRPDGIQRNFVCGNLFVRYISMKFRPTPAEFITATIAFLRTKWPQRHPAKPPTHAPTAPPPNPEPRRSPFYDYHLHSRD